MHSWLYQHALITHLGVFSFQAEDWFRDRSQTAGRQGGAAHPGLYDAHKHLYTGEKKSPWICYATPCSNNMWHYWFSYSLLLPATRLVFVFRSFQFIPLTSAWRTPRLLSRNRNGSLNTRRWLAQLTACQWWIFLNPVITAETGWMVCGGSVADAEEVSQREKIN